jgi:hypothetical protein
MEEPITYITNTGVWVIHTEDSCIVDVTYNDCSIKLTKKREDIIFKYLKQKQLW